MHIYRNISKIQALSFDLDDTLYDNHPVIARLEREMARWLKEHHPASIIITDQDWQNLKQQVLKAQPELQHNVTLWRQTQIEHGLRSLGYSDHQALVSSKEAIKHVLWLRNQIKIPEETLRILSQLQARYPLIAITNGNVNPAAIGLGTYFSHIFKAGLDGRSKPYADMFQLASKTLNLPYNRILHIGDHLNSDVLGANQSGLQSCWLNVSGQTMLQQTEAKSLPSIEITTLKELLCLV